MNDSVEFSDEERWEANTMLLEEAMTKAYGTQPWPPPLVVMGEEYALAHGHRAGEGWYRLEKDGSREYYNETACAEARALCGCL